MKITPTEIRRLPGTGIKISWSNGLVHELSSTALRTNCPCATCREDRGDTSHARPISTDAAPQKKRSMLTVIEHTATEQLDLTEIWGIGNYALGIAWADGHSSGIYSFEYLYELGTAQQ